MINSVTQQKNKIKHQNKKKLIWTYKTVNNVQNHPGK